MTSVDFADPRNATIQASGFDWSSVVPNDVLLEFRHRISDVVAEVDRKEHGVALARDRATNSRIFRDCVEQLITILILILVGHMVGIYSREFESFFLRVPSVRPKVR